MHTADISPDYTVFNFWKDHIASVPKWGDFVKNVMLIQPLSGTVERVFSFLNNSFREQQLSSLEEYLKASIMIQYRK